MFKLKDPETRKGATNSNGKQSQLRPRPNGSESDLRPRVSSNADFTTLDNYTTHPPWSGPGTEDQKWIKRRWHHTLKKPAPSQGECRARRSPARGSLLAASSLFRPPHRVGSWSALSSHISVLWPVSKAVPRSLLRLQFPSRKGTFPHQGRELQGAEAESERLDLVT